jgi:hypothetical protein
MYKGQRMKCDTVIEEKTNQLARLLTGKTSTINFGEPSANLERFDSRELRDRINSLTSDDVKRLDVGKGTLHYLRRNAFGERPFKLYGKTVKKLQAVTA